MAKIPPEVLRTVLDLLEELLILMDEVKALEYTILVEFCETNATIRALEELQNITERLRNSYSRLHILLLRIAEAQPKADIDTLNLLERSREQAQANLDASRATIRESQGDIDLL